MKDINLQSKIFQAFLFYQKELGEAIKYFQLVSLNNASFMGESAPKSYCSSNIHKYKKLDIFFYFLDNSNRT